MTTVKLEYSLLCVMVVMLPWWTNVYFLKNSWINDEERCLAAGVPAENIVAKRKQDLALEMVKHARQKKLEYFCIGCDGFYGEDPAFLRDLDAMPEIFMADVHKDQHIYLSL